MVIFEKSKQLGRKMTFTKSKTLLALSLLSGIILNSATAADTIKVGVLHSLSGTMAISETTLKDTMLMLIEDQNKNGGLLGKQLEAVVVDPASKWPLFAEKAVYRPKNENSVDEII
mgnify:CR=1 FL=1|jgi:urea transport system substrate-binding protein|tara:strand:+ start:405 stop:752 length:348 start_codon:yes stop_codon:yes gene_type:complete